MSDEGKKATRAELAEAVHELRDEVARLRAEQAAHHGHGHCGHAHCNWGHCGCWILHSYMPQAPGCAPWYPTWTVTTAGNLNITTAGDTTWGSTTFTGVTANAASIAGGAPPVMTLSSSSNQGR